MTWHGGRSAAASRANACATMRASTVTTAAASRIMRCLEPPLELRQRRRPNGDVIVGTRGPGVAEIGHVGKAQARERSCGAMRIAVGGNEVATTASHRAVRARRSAARTANGYQSTCASGTSQAFGCSRRAAGRRAAPRASPLRLPAPP